MDRNTHEMLNRVMARGISMDDAYALRRISMTLQRWYELECGTERGGIVRDKDTGLPYWESSYLVSRNGKPYRQRVSDRERGALRRLDTIMARYPDLAAYVQTDPRGAALYVYNKASPTLAMSTIDCCYSSIGTAIYK